MIGASLVVFAVLGQVPAVDPSDLIAQLGSSRYVERQAASSALERLGRRSLPALKAACEQRDPEIRSRASAILARIEGALLTQPSQVNLDFQDAPLPEVIRSLSEQTGVKLTLHAENSPQLLTRRVSLHETAPLSFWKAMDRLCEAAHLQYNLGLNGLPNGREPTFPLFEGGIRPSAPVSDSGPFRVSLVALHYQRDVSFPPAPLFARNPQGPAPVNRPTPAAVNEQFYAQMQVSGEPRLSLIQNAPLRILEAVDDRGNPLVVPATGNPDLRRSGYFGFGTGSVILVQAAMTRPKTPGATIKRLKGLLPVSVSTRKPGPLIVPLSGATGRTFQNDDVALIVHEIKGPLANRPHSIEVSIRAGGRSANPSSDGHEGMFIRPDSHQQQLEVTDAQGHPIPWYQSTIDSEAGRLTVTLASPEQGASAAELHYYSLVRASTEVPFEFSGIPMP